MSSITRSSRKIDSGYIVKSLIGIAIMIFFRFIPAPAPITQVGMSVIGQFIGLIFLWSLVDMMWPTFAAIVIFGLDAFVIYPNSWQQAGIHEAGQLSFGNWITIFVIGCLLICYALEKVGTVRRICMWFITRKIAKKSPWMFTFMFLLSGLVISLFLDVLPAQFFLLGIAHEMFRILGFKEGDRWPKYIVIGITFTVVLGFAMTPICHTLPILWMSIYSAITGVPSNMLLYMAVGLPVGAAIWAVMMVWFKKVIKLVDHVPELEKMNWDEIEAMKPGRMSLQERIVVVVSILLIGSWLLPGILALVAPTSLVYTTMAALSDSSFLLMAIVILAIIKVDGEALLNLPEAFSKIAWLPVVLLAGIMMIASALAEDPTGVPAFIATVIVPAVAGMDPFLMVALICVLCIVLTNIANNVPVGILFVSAGVPLFLQIGVNPIIIAIAVSVSANLAFTIPPAYAPVGVAYADPYCDGKTVFRNGCFMALASCVICALLIYPLASLFS